MYKIKKVKKKLNENEKKICKLKLRKIRINLGQI